MAFLIDKNPLAKDCWVVFHPDCEFEMKVYSERRPDKRSIKAYAKRYGLEVKECKTQMLYAEKAASKRRNYERV